MESFKINYVFYDDEIVVVNKPVDLPVHKNDFMPNDAAYLTKLLGEKFGKWVYNVHRLDAKTSGIMVLAFTKEAANKLAVQFEQKKVEKKYLAIVQGIPGEGFFDKKVLVKKKTKFKKPAKTYYKTLKTISLNISHKNTDKVALSLVEVAPETGRWHQIRQHFAQNRNDILGDSHHGDFALNKLLAKKTGIKRLFLHASSLSFFHPLTNENISFTVKCPNEFDILFDKLLNENLFEQLP